jgi:ABC-type Fe3+-hydroxamate transport system substrate-binding protein
MVCELIEEYEGQSLYIGVTPDNNDNLDNIYPSQTEVKKIEDNITTFSANYYNKLKTYRNKLKHILDRGKRVVIWGAGSRGVILLNTFKDLNISYAVDINPKKQGMYIPGVGQKIIPPEFLQKYRPDVIIVMNPIYMNEIQNMVKNIGIEPNFLMA